MLYKLVDDTCRKIERLDIGAETPRMLGQIERARPELRARLKQSSAGKAAQDLIANAVAAGALQIIKGIPKIAAFLSEKTKNRRVQPQLRCAVAGILSYFVQPRDLIPDDSPGGYGYLDDSAIVRAGLLQYLNVERSRDFNMEEEEKYVNMVASLVPPAVLPALQAAVGAMSTAFQIFNLLPAPIAELTLQQIIANPLQASTPTAPPGFSPTATPSYGGGRWSGGAYFEGGSVIVPGGPSLIDGKLFIPD